MREHFDLNEDWLFTEHYTEELLADSFDESALKKVRIPHTVKETPYDYFDASEYRMLSGYRRHLKAPKEWRGKRVLLTFSGAAHLATVYLNGEEIGTHACGYTAFTLDLSERLRYGEDNLLTVRLDSREDLNIPPFGYVVDYMTYGGIYREVSLEVCEPAYIEDAFLQTAGSIDRPVLRTQVTLHLPDADGPLEVRQFIHRPEGRALLVQREESSRAIRFEKGVLTLEAPAEVLLWSPERPSLYRIDTELWQGERQLDLVSVNFGFRFIEMRADKMLLNGEQIRIRGLNRHQSYPYVGYAMPANMQRYDALLLKTELGVNAVRTSHYPQSHAFLDACDEFGLLVFTEIPGWQHIGDEAWKEQAVKNTEEMVLQYRNHPSIFLWGVRINESEDDDAFYEKTNAAAHRLDPTRPTGGVRAGKKGHLLEDVYTYNDFLHDGQAPGCDPKAKVTSDPAKPYLISEYNGHMYPTKTFDPEEHRREHAIRHANVLEAVAAQEDILGSFGWCMFDYNTHKDFGSGDRICYHGVMDMFRNPKMAAAVYACQQEAVPVLELSSSMDIGEHPGCNRGQTWIFSNADSVRMYKNDRLLKEYHPSDSPYSHLAHGPILIDDYIGDAITQGEDFKPAQAAAVKEILNHTARFGMGRLPKRILFQAAKMIALYHMGMDDAVRLYQKYVGDWGGRATVYRFEAIKGGKVVRTLVKAPSGKLHLEATPSHRVLREGKTYDVAEVRICAKDENDNTVVFFQEPIRLSVTGPAEIIGPDVISCKGGMTGTYLRTTGEAGKVVLTLRAAQTEDVTIELEVEKGPAGAESV
jgi:beta-galactosidase